MDKIKTGIIGCGKVGHMHARALKNLPESLFIAVCDNDTNEPGICKTI